MEDSRKMIKGWRHKAGVHCGSAAVRDVCGYYGCDISETMCFGLGAGLGFYYSCDDAMDPSRIIHLRGPLMEVSFLAYLGLDITDWNYEEDDNRAFKDLKKSVDSDIPVLIQTDIRYLEYFDSKTHFPGHVIVVCGYDETESSFYVADNSFEPIQSVSFESMKKARSSKAKPYPLSNNRIEVGSIREDFDLHDAVLSAIMKNARMMLEGRATLRGVSGVEVLREWAEDLPRWKNLSDWKWTARFAYQVICRRGVCGAGFRWFYRDFLRETSDILMPFYSWSLADEMDAIGERWSVIGALFKSISESSSPERGFLRAADIAFEIYEHEKNFFSMVLERRDPWIEG